jgi:hypothetical protein
MAFQLLFKLKKKEKNKHQLSFKKGVKKWLKKSEETGEVNLDTAHHTKKETGSHHSIIEE